MKHLSTFIRSAILCFSIALFAIPVLASASVSVSIQSLSPSTNISVGTNLTFSVSASGFTSPSYTVSDPLNGSTVVSGDINSSGNFSWTPANSDVGTHNLTIAVNDSLGDSATTTESINVSAAPSVSISSPSPGNSVTSGQAVSFDVSANGFTNPSYSVSDSFGGSTVSNGDINSSGDFSWTPGSSQTGTHDITVFVTDSLGHSAQANETISVGAAPTVVISSLSPGSSVNAGQTLSFVASASNFNSPSYSVSDSFGGSTVSNGNINSSGDFSWTPSSNDVGQHAITIYVNDSSGHTATASETITVNSGEGTGGTGNASIQGLEPGTTDIIGQPVTFTVAASGFSNPVFSVSDSFGGSSLSNSDINSAGYLSWTPQNNDVGTHDITIYVNDSSGGSGNVTLSLTVEQPNIAITSISPGEDIAPNSPLTFTVSQQGFTNPNYTVSDTFSGTSITDSDINSSGDFSWTPTTEDDGTHTITVYATDSAGHSANTAITIDVTSGTNVTLSAISPGSTVAPGTPISFNAYAYGFTSPTFTVQDSFSGSSLTDADINSSGAFSWTPTAADIGTHTINITATDAYGHYGTEQTTLVVSGSASASGSTLGELEAELQQDEAQISSLGVSSGVVASYVFTADLSPGMTSSEVTQLQTVLEEQGDLSVAPTGYYGSLTTAAVEKFQAAHGIAQVGVVGPETMAALNALMVPQSSTSSSTNPGATVGDGYVFSNFIGYGDTSNDVTELQKRLTAFGVYSGPITGYFGSLTQTAVEAFQGQHGIQQVGYVGPATRAALDQ